MADITLENMPQPFTVYDDNGIAVYRDAFSYVDRRGKTAAQLKVMAQLRYANFLQTIEDAKSIVEEPVVLPPVEDIPIEDN